MPAENNTCATHTKGKHTFTDAYSSPDAKVYMWAMAEWGYCIGDHTAVVSLRAMADLFPKDGGDRVLLELCAGFGLSMSAIRTLKSVPEIYDHYFGEKAGERPTEVGDAQLAYDKKFFDSLPRREGLPHIVGADVASNALAYGETMGIFDSTICRNLEADEGCFGLATPNSLTGEELALVARARLVVATGAFSYISAKTIDKLFASWEDPDSASGPVFIFYPLVATDATDMISLFKSKGLEVYYEPAKHWLPQRRFADPAEAAKVTAAQDKVLLDATAASGGNATIPPPEGAQEGYLHATVLVAGPPCMNITTTLGPKWCGAK